MFMLSQGQIPVTENALDGSYFALLCAPTPRTSFTFQPCLHWSNGKTKTSFVRSDGGTGIGVGP